MTSRCRRGRARVRAAPSSLNCPDLHRREGRPMGRDIDRTEFTRDDRLRFRDKVKANLAALRTLVDGGNFETGRRTCGVEMEVYITDADGSPVPLNAKLLERMASADFQT